MRHEVHQHHRVHRREPTGEMGKPSWPTSRFWIGLCNTFCFALDVFLHPHKERDTRALSRFPPRLVDITVLLTHLDLTGIIGDAFNIRGTMPWGKMPWR